MVDREEVDGVVSVTTAAESPCDELRPVVALDFFGILTQYEGGAEHEIVAWINDDVEPTPRPGASDLAQAYDAAGYDILYFHTAPTELEIRGQAFNAVMAAWLAARGFPVGEGVHYSGWNGQGDLDRGPELGIVDELVRLQAEGFSPAAGYTRSESRAYSLIVGGIPVHRVFILGPEAGATGTTIIPGDDLATHATAIPAPPDPAEPCAGG